MTDETFYHRSLSLQPRGKAVRTHMAYHASDGSLNIDRERGYYYWKHDQRFDDYATSWEKSERGFFNYPVIDSHGTIIGYWGWLTASVIFVPASAPTSIKWTTFEGGEEREYQTNLRLADIVDNFFIDRVGGGHKLGGPYPVFVSASAPRTPQGSREAAGAPAKYNVIVDIDGRVAAVTDSDIGGTKSPTSGQILLQTTMKVVFNKFVRNPLLKSLVSGLWTRA